MFAERDIVIQGPKYWNSIDQALKTKSTLDQFKLAMEVYGPV